MQSSQEPQDKSNYPWTCIYINIFLIIIKLIFHVYSAYRKFKTKPSMVLLSDRQFIRQIKTFKDYRVKLYLVTSDIFDSKLFRSNYIEYRLFNVLRTQNIAEVDFLLMKFDLLYRIVFYKQNEIEYVMKFSKEKPKIYYNLTSDKENFEHKNLVKIHEINEIDLRNYSIGENKTIISIKMEFLPIRIDFSGYEDFNIDYIKVLYDILSGLKYIHSKGWVHGNVKISSIKGIRDSETNNIVYKLIKLDSLYPADDIEFSRRIDYIFDAPEVIKDKTRSHKSDIYSIGAIACYIKMVNDAFEKYKYICEKCLNKKQEEGVKYINLYERANEGRIFKDINLDIEHGGTDESINFNLLESKNKLPEYIYKKECIDCDEPEYLIKSIDVRYKLFEVNKYIETIENKDLREFLKKCCAENVNERLSAEELLKSDEGENLFKLFYEHA